MSEPSSTRRITPGRVVKLLARYLFHWVSERAASAGRKAASEATVPTGATAGAECHVCGAPLRSLAKHCPQCGRPTVARRSRRGQRWIVGVGCCLLALFAAWYLYSRASSRADRWQDAAHQLELREQRVRSDLQAVTKNLAVAAIQRDDFESKLAQAQRHHEVISSELQVASQNLRVAETQRDALEGKLQQAIRDQQVISSELQALRNEPEAVRLLNELTSVRETLTATEARLAELQNLQGQVAQLESQRGEAEATLRQARRDLDELRNELSVSKTDRERLQHELRAGEDTLTGLRERLATAASQLAQKDEVIEALRREIGERQLNKCNYASNWEKLNGWLGEGRAITRKDVLDTLGNPSSIEENVWGKPELGVKWVYKLSWDRSKTVGVVRFGPDGKVRGISPPFSFPK